MVKKLSFILLVFLLCTGCAHHLDLPQPAGRVNIASLEPLKKDERILVLAPHPDDEALGCAGIIQQALAAGAKVRVAYLTNGDHNQLAFIVYEKRLTFKKREFIYMGEVRRKEAIKAMKLLGIDEKDLIFLGYPDFGTFRIFSQYWRAKKPFKDIMTHIPSVPYKGNLSFGAPYVGESILGDLEKVLQDYKPDKIFVSHSADVNVDHKALYLFLQIALRDLEKKIPKPKVYPYLVHCVGWPLPRHYRPQLSLAPPQKFLHSQINWQEFRLSPEQLDKKHRAILCYKSQTESSAFYLLSFARQNELFGDYPEIELDRQVSLKEKAPLFFGFSDMFTDSGIDTGEQAKISEDPGGVSYAVVDHSLLVRVEKSRNLSRRFGIMLYLFGYSSKTPFSAMPKVRIITLYNRFNIFDGRKLIKAEGVAAELKSNVLILKVPLKILGEPEFILTSIKTYTGKLPFNAIGFRKIDIK